MVYWLANVKPNQSQKKTTQPSFTQETTLKWDKRSVIFCIALFSYTISWGILWGWHPPFWYAVFRGDLDGTQYAKGRYAVRRNSVISYADINLYLKKVQFSLKNNTRDTQSEITLKNLRALFTRAFWGSFQHL